MKVDYPIKLFNKFTKEILCNPVFTYFLIAIIIGYTIGLRNNPDLYYHILFNPVILAVVIILTMLILLFNKVLGFMLAFSILALYYPKTSSSDNYEVTEHFNTSIVPIAGEDSNIVDDTKSKNNKNKKTKLNKTKLNKTKLNKTKISKKEEDSEDSDKEDVTEDYEDVDEESIKDSSKSDNEIKSLALKNLNPGFFKPTKKEDNKSTKTTPNGKNNSNIKSNNKSEPTPTPNNETSESFLGDVRNVINNLDAVKGGVNAKQAIKKINDLFYKKHKSEIQKIIDEEDDDDTDDEDNESDEDFF